MSRRPVIAAAQRTVFGRNRGGLSAIRPDDLLGRTLESLLAQAPDLDPARIDDVVMGDANGAGEDNRNVARMGALLAGLPTTVPGVTLNRLCGSGAEAMVQAARAVRSGDMDIVIAGGVESMSRAPYVLPKPDRALDPGMGLEQTTVGWRMINPRFPQHWTRSLGACAETTAARRNITRDAQDAWALRSHQRVAAAWAHGLHDGFAFSVDGVLRDECIREDASLESLAALKPAFTPDGSVTAGNSSPINDGAVAALIVDEAVAGDLGLEPIGAILGAAVIAGEPDDFAAAPVPAIRKLLARTGHSLEQIDLVEINEAFAAVVLTVLHDMPDLDPQIVNVNGGAIAIGHPVGASAARVVVDACRELQRRGGGLGIASACIGVGLGIAILVEVP
jgi:acetyl-CoA acetyltransferase family protein